MYECLVERERMREHFVIAMCMCVESAIRFIPVNSRLFICLIFPENVRFSLFFRRFRLHFSLVFLSFSSSLSLFIRRLLVRFVNHDMHTLVCNMF